MLFTDFASAQAIFLLGSFVLAFMLGAVANKTNFCTMGAVSDWVNMGDKGRLYSWIFAIAVAILAVSIFEYAGLLNLSSTFPPYRSSSLIIGENIIGGLMFGVGMTLASGCGNKNLVRLGGGNLKSIVVITTISIVAYFMIFPLPDSSNTLFSLLFYDWLRPLSIDLASPQDIGAIINETTNSVNLDIIRLISGLSLALGLLWLVFSSNNFKTNKDHIYGGLLVGLIVFAAWWLTSSILVLTDDGNYSLLQFVAEWDMLAESEAGKPFEQRSLATQSFTFVNPTAYSFGYVLSGFNSNYLTFGVMAVLGVILGSFTMAMVTKSFRIEWFVDIKDFFRHFIGAILMAMGAVLALGCTIGQAITGMSTLALGSILTTVAIIFGCALTMKIQYYQIVYEHKANFFTALISSLVDLKLLPSSYRRLDKI